MIKDMKKRLWVVLGLLIPITILSPMMMTLFNYQIAFPGDKYIVFVLATIVFLYGGKPFLTHAKHEIKHHKPGMMLLVSLGIITAYLYSALGTFVLTDAMDYYFELTTLIAIMLFGHIVEMKAKMRASVDIDSLKQLLPNEAVKVDATGTTTVAVTALKVGDRVLVRPGAKVPIDGTIIEGASAIDTSAMTGESLPVEASVGDDVVAGTVNGEGALTVEVGAVSDDSYFNRMGELLKQTEAQKSAVQSLADRYAGYLFYFAVAVAFFALVIWWWLRNFQTAVPFVVSTLVIACPHALGLAIPLVHARTLSLAVQSGFLIQQIVPFEAAHDIDTIVFDKTGTLTTGDFEVQAVEAADSSSRDDVLGLAYSLEYYSEHPLAQGIVRYAEQQGIARQMVDDFQATPGEGVHGTIGGHHIHVLSEHAAQQQGVILPKEVQPGTTLSIVLRNGDYLGYVALADTIAPHVKATIDTLHQQGIQTVMMTGDREAVAQTVAEALGIDQYVSECRPEDKAEKIAQLEKNGHHVMMVGDGVNDALALSEASLGVAIGTGTAIAIETADVMLVKSDLADIVTLLDLAKRSHRKMLQNLWWGAGYNIIALPLAAGLFTPWNITVTPALSAILMSASTVITALNAASLHVKKPQ
ncbi:MAG: cadmium-translocating P-type ATPase [Aerococcus sp.]|nr:cadmium-translocating P-type ATPase [Aerococcus sp.]